MKKFKAIIALLLVILLFSVTFTAKGVNADYCDENHDPIQCQLNG